MHGGRAADPKKCPAAFSGRSLTTARTFRSQTASPSTNRDATGLFAIADKRAMSARWATRPRPTSP
eukprot:3877934-Alexandrium_andersonii.AAC.1